MKKIFLVLIQILIFTFSEFVYADNAVTVSIETVTAKIGDQIEMNISITENAQISGGNFVISYDDMALKLLSASQTELLAGYSCIINTEYGKGKIKTSWAGTNALVDGGDIFILKFEVLSKTKDTESVQIEKMKIVDGNGNEINTISNDGIINIFSDDSNISTGGSLRTSTSLNSLNKESENAEINQNLILTFIDVKETDWYYEAVKFAFERGITNGVSENTYAPNDKVTRGQFITMLCRAYGVNEMAGDNFDDCGDTWYTGYLATAKQLGISNGIGDNMFAPEKEITREEMVTLIYNYLKSVGEVDTETGETTFTDDSSISDWAKNGVAFASNKGYVSGKDNNVFDPNSNATRAELAQIFFNIFK